MNWEEANELGLKMVAALAPACERIMVAGSVRRRCAEVNDLDVVLIPKGSLAELEAALRKSPAKLESYGREHNWIAKIRMREANEFKVDLWLARPQQGDLFSLIKSNWGSVLLCRTGSILHNTQLCSVAMARDMKFSYTRGLVDLKSNEVIACETEEAVYEALGLKWRPPEDRVCL